MLDPRRKGRITGSIAGAILGYSPYMTREDAMRSMVREWVGAPSEFEGNVATEWGKFNEKSAILDFELETGLSVEPCGFSNIGWLGATPDGFIGDDAVLEVKCPYNLKNNETPIFKTIDEQLHYKAQIHIEMYANIRKKCYFFQWCPFGHFLQVVDFDGDFFEEIFQKLKAFYDEYLIERENPEKYLEEKVKEIDAPQFYDAYIKAKAVLEEAELALDKAKNDLIKLANGKKSKIGDLLIYEVERDGSVSYAKAIKDLMPSADLEAYRGKPSKYWVVK
jgi:putative phage-type endonuclease